MATNTPNMSLRAWDLGGDHYSHDDLTANWNRIDAHDHSSGKGAALSGDSFPDNSISGVKLADGTIDLSKLTDLAYAILSPVGITLPWFRPSAGISPPTGWAVPVGQTLLSTQHSFDGGGSVTLPDLRNRFVLGAATSGTGAGSGSPPDIAGMGGNHTANLSHSHTVNAHAHGIQAEAPGTNATGEHRHYHRGPIGHSLNGSLHYVIKGFDHVLDSIPGTTGTFYAQDTTGTLSEGVKTITPLDVGAGNDIELFKVGSTYEGIHGHTVNSHAHTGATGVSQPATDAALGSNDIRPNFIGLLYIMKVLY